MAYTLSQLLQDVYKRLNKIIVKPSSSGTTASVVVDSIIGIDDDDSWNNGYLFVINTTDGLAPKGQYARITDYVSSTGTFSFAASSFTTAIGAGDTVGYVGADEYPLLDLVDQANLALQEIGDIPLVDTTTLTTASNQTEYAVSVGWKRNPPFRIDIQQDKNDSDDNKWLQIFAWEYIPAAPGSTGLIIFRENLPAGYDLRIWYEDVHPELTAYNSVISESIRPTLVQVATLDNILSWKNAGLSGQDDFLLQFRNEIMQKREAEMSRMKPWKPNRKNKIVTYTSNSSWKDRIQPPDAP